MSDPVPAPAGAASAEDTPEAAAIYVTLPPAIPVLPLTENVVYPGALYPLILQGGEAAALLRQVTETRTPVGLFVQRDPAQDAPDLDDLYAVGTAALIYETQAQPDGTLQVMVQGLVRIRRGPAETTEPYFVAQVTTLPEPVLADEQARHGAVLQTLERQAREQFEALLSGQPAVAEDLRAAAAALDDPLQLAYLIAATSPLPVAGRQAVLEADGALEKLRVLLPLLDQLTAAVGVGQEINAQVQQQVRRTEREFLLRQQLKAIQHELGEDDPLARERRQLAERLEAAGLPDEALAVAMRELEHLSSLTPAAPEYTGLRTYLDWLADLPWQPATPPPIDIATARMILDRDHYGLTDVKERILQYLAVRKLRLARQGESAEADAGPRRNGEPILCFVGPPGVGKTSLGQSIAEALGRPFVRLSLGGVHDEAEIRGHRRTYLGALPGRILGALRRVQSNDPVFMLDEIDKLGSEGRGDPAAALLEVLDPEQQPEFRDHYLDLPFDLSSVLFIATANVVDTIPPALRDRLEMCELSGYTEEGKLEIARRYLVPRQLAAHALTEADLQWVPGALPAIIRDYTREAGVRELDRQLATICRQVATAVAEGQAGEAGGPYVITAETVAALLGKPRYMAEAIEATDRPGVATGLVWTPAGGDIVFIEASKMPGAKTLTITGQLGDVMKESAQAALTWVRSRAAALGIDPYFFDAHDIHLHVPAGAVPKDGPSAGVTLAVALTSLLADIPLRPDVAMTGEVTLRGRVLAIGGLKEKLLAALRGGIKTVLIPEENQKDLAEIPANAKEGLEIVPVAHVDEVLRRALTAPTEPIEWTEADDLASQPRPGVPESPPAATAH
jgi:ATP-dependent Lon protease